MSKTQEVLSLEAELKRMREDMKLNASMLARQCDLAREAETRMMAERRRCLKAVDDEPEPDEAYGVAVRTAKANIRKRIEGGYE